MLTVDPKCLFPNVPKSLGSIDVQVREDGAQVAEHSQQALLVQDEHVQYFCQGASRSWVCVKTEINKRKYTHGILTHVHKIIL